MPEPVAVGAAAGGVLGVLVVTARYGAAAVRLSRDWITAPMDVKAIKAGIVVERETIKAALNEIMQELKEHDTRQEEITTQMAVRTALWQQFVEDRKAQDALILAAITKGSPRGNPGERGERGEKGEKGLPGTPI